MSTTTIKKKTTKKALAGATVAKKKVTKKESLFELAKEVQEIFKKHNVKPFNRKEIYGNL